MNNKFEPPEKWILLGIPALFIIGTIFHFLFDITGEFPIIAAIAPKNESVWEHIKMVVVPTIAWWGIYYLSKGKTYDINPSKWFLGALASLVSSILLIPLLFYTYTEAFGIESVIIDILILLFSVMIGQLIGLHFYQHSEKFNPKISIILMFLILFIFIIFTFYPPDLPVFIEG